MSKNSIHTDPIQRVSRLVGGIQMIQYQASHNFIHRKITGLDVLISVGENIANFDGYIQLNATATALWNFLSTPRSEDDMAAMLAEQYGISPEEARADAAEFLEMLKTHHMVVEMKDGK